MCNYMILLSDRRYSSSSSSSDDDQKLSPPPAPKISMSFSRPKTSLQPAKGIQIKLASQPKPAPLVQKTKIINVFNADESDDEEEMPPEARMRMKNIGQLVNLFCCKSFIIIILQYCKGKDTPTSSGPNSFGKTKQGTTATIFSCSLHALTH